MEKQKSAVFSPIHQGFILVEIHSLFDYEGISFHLRHDEIFYGGGSKWIISHSESGTAFAYGDTINEAFLQMEIIVQFLGKKDIEKTVNKKIKDMFAIIRDKFVIDTINKQP